MPNTTATRTTVPKALTLPRWLGWVAAVVAVLLVTVAASAVLRGPRFVSQVSLVNPSAYALDVQVAGADRDGWMLLGTATPNTVSVVAQVVDQGDTWVFRVGAQGVGGGDFAISRADLVRSGWRVTIPAAVIARLQAQSIPVSPTTK